MSIADKVDLLYESFGEIEKGNPERVFVNIYTESLSVIMSFEDRPSVQYFLDQILPDMLNEEFADRDMLAKLTRSVMAKQ